MNEVYFRATLAYLGRKKTLKLIALAEQKTLAEFLDQYEHGMLTRGQLMELLEEFWGGEGK